MMIAINCNWPGAKKSYSKGGLMVYADIAAVKMSPSIKYKLIVL